MGSVARDRLRRRELRPYLVDAVRRGMARTLDTIGARTDEDGDGMSDTANGRAAGRDRHRGCTRDRRRDHHALARSGVHVAAGYSVELARPPDELAGKLDAEGASVSVHQGNVGEPEDCQRVVNEVLEQKGRVDHLVNNAGITVDKTMRKMTVDDWHAVLRINLSGAFYMSKAVLDHMLEREFGRIVNISSVIGQTGRHRPGELRRVEVRSVRVRQSLAQEVARKGDHGELRGAGLHRRPRWSPRCRRRRWRRSLQEIPVGRLGTAHEIARAVAVPRRRRRRLHHRLRHLGQRRPGHVRDLSCPGTG